MGYKTVMIVRHDALNSIESNPEEFVRNLLDAIRRPSSDDDIAAGGYCNAATVVRPTGSPAPVSVVTEGPHAETVVLATIS
jgi:hypothetical protein